MDDWVNILKMWPMAMEKDMGLVPNEKISKFFL